MATYSKSVLDAQTENPAQLFVDFLRFLESTQPITVPSTSAIRVTSSAPTITIPCVQPPAVESTQPITVPSTSAICGMFTSFYFLICLCISWQLQYLFLITTLIIFSYIFCGFYDSSRYSTFCWLDTTGQEGGRLAWHMSRPLCQLIHHLYML
ncbi:uncharacterized protein LOC105849042 isoform X3 [Hydra vulgaris]|uniref:uncharacterized protein LOC105849042 isoform X3 n=1 Tax=Hydra vulgaris TaxID=6087 RepID=UPI001F5EA0A1|nr:uncharacterized protein LOC105849042 isoform X4 [Hydra vulgaris]